MIGWDVSGSPLLLINRYSFYHANVPTLHTSLSCFLDLRNNENGIINRWDWLINKEGIYISAHDSKGKAVEGFLV